MMNLNTDTMVSVSIPLSTLRLLLTSEQMASVEPVVIPLDTVPTAPVETPVVPAKPRITRHRQSGLYMLSAKGQQHHSVRSCSHSAKDIFTHLQSHVGGATRHELKDELHMTPGQVTSALRVLTLKHAIEHVPATH